MSKVAVRYCSKTKAGNTKRIATTIAEGANVEAVSISDEPVLSEKVDVLFLGGAPYANIMAPELRKYAEALDKEMPNYTDSDIAEILDVPISTIDTASNFASYERSIVSG